MNSKLKIIEWYIDDTRLAEMEKLKELSNLNATRVTSDKAKASPTTKGKKSSSDLRICNVSRQWNIFNDIYYYIG